MVKQTKKEKMCNTHRWLISYSVIATVVAVGVIMLLAFIDVEEGWQKGSVRHDSHVTTIVCYNNNQGVIEGKEFSMIISSFRRGYSSIEGSLKYLYFGEENIYRYDTCRLGNGHVFLSSEIEWIRY